MWGALAVIVVYLAVSMIVGIWSGKVGKTTSEDFFLADRGLGGILMFFTLFATNISGFAYFGAPGGAYHQGVGFFGYLATTTTMAAVFFYLFGHRVWLLGKKYGYMTPSELFGEKYESETVRIVYFVVLTLMTTGYACVQPIAAGYVLSGLTGGAIPPWVGSTLMVVVVTIYVLAGGLRAVAWTDFVQGVLMILLVIVAVCIVAVNIGGPVAASTEIATKYPELLMRQKFTWQKWLSFGMIVAMCIPIFPQMFTKFFASKSSQSLKVSMCLYPLAMIAIYVPILFMGMWGHAVFPDLHGKEAEKIIPMLLGKYVPLWLGALILSAPLAAIMSTVSSQLITISTMFTRDIYARYFNRDCSADHQVRVGRIFIFAAAFVVFFVSLKPPASVLTIATWNFAGYAVAFPATMAALFWRRANAMSIVSSIVAGEFVLLLFVLDILPKSLAMGFEPFLPAWVVALVVLLVMALANGKAEVKQSKKIHDFLDGLYKAKIST